DGPLPLGGEGHYAVARMVPAIRWDSVSSGRGLYLLATPALFHPGRPKWPERIPAEHLRAAASAAPLAVSGWDTTRNGPRPTRFAIPAGGVYFTAADWVLEGDLLCSDPEAVAEGWGFTLRGEWHP